MQQARAAARANAGDQLRRSLAHGQHIVAIDLGRGNAQRLGARARGLRAGGHGRRARGRGNLVVLADEQHRQLVDLRPVQRFEKRPAVDRAIAKEADRNRVLAAQFEGMGRAHGDRQAGGDDAVRAQHADRKIGDVHGAALALVVAGGAAKQLAHHARAVGALGQRMAVAAVGGGEQVARMQMGADARGHGLLARGQVQRPLDQRRFGTGRGALAPDLHATLAGAFGRVLEGTDTDHGPVEGKQVGHGGKDRGRGARSQAGKRMKKHRRPSRSNGRCALCAKHLRPG
ncbi:hypothetical protein D3C71_1380750 [compost metagenome]